MYSGNACPRCGNGPLFRGFVSLQPKCTSCGLDYDFADAGDGPAVFVILIAGAVLVAAALWLELTYEPPMWVTMVIFMPATALVCLGMLRPLKAFMIHQQYRTKAKQGRLSE
jgi:uncharacterized protein (DUF983 family)